MTGSGKAATATRFAQDRMIALAAGALLALMAWTAQGVAQQAEGTDEDSQPVIVEEAPALESVEDPATGTESETQDADAPAASAETAPDATAPEAPVMEDVTEEAPAADSSGVGEATEAGTDGSVSEEAAPGTTEAEDGAAEDPASDVGGAEAEAPATDAEAGAETPAPETTGDDTAGEGATGDDVAGEDAADEGETEGVTAGEDAAPQGVDAEIAQLRQENPDNPVYEDEDWLAAKRDGTLIQSHGYSFFGDLTYPADYEHFDYVNPDAPKGGEISVWAPGTFDSMNPYSRKGRAGRYSWMVYESLMGEEPSSGGSAPADVYGEMYGLLASSLEYDEAKTWVIFHMRPEARFSNGDPVTAHDVVFSHNLLLEQGLPSYAQAVKKRIKSAEALDDHTVKFTFADDISRRSLIDQVGSVPVWPQKWFEENDARLDEPRLDAAPGSGPYVLDSYDINRRITYKRNPDYWGKDLPINQGRHNFDTIRVEYFADDTGAFEAFKAGEYTFRAESNSKQWATGYDFPAVNEGYVVREELPDGNPPTPSGFVFNLARDMFKDKRVRQAVALGYNFEWTNESLQNGLFKQRVSFTQDTPLMAEGKPVGAEREFLEGLGDVVPAEVMNEPAVVPHTSDADRLTDRDNQRKAMALLDEAGWTMQLPPKQPPRWSMPVVVGVSLLILVIAGFIVMRAKGTVVRVVTVVVGLGAIGGVYAYFGTPIQPEGKMMRRNAEGRLMTINIPVSNSSSSTLDSIVETFVQNLQSMGIAARMEKVDAAQYTLRERERQYDMVFDSYASFLGTGTGLHQRYGSAESEFSLFNPAGLASPLVDAVIDASLATQSSEEEDASLKALDRVLRYEFFMIPVWYNDSYWVAYWDQYDHPEIPTYSLGELDFWWYDKDKAQALRDAGALR